jgi:hypothetical protein
MSPVPPSTVLLFSQREAGRAALPLEGCTP